MLGCVNLESMDNVHMKSECQILCSDFRICKLHYSCAICGLLMGQSRFAGRKVGARPESFWLPRVSYLLRISPRFYCVSGLSLGLDQLKRKDIVPSSSSIYRGPSNK